MDEVMDGKGMIDHWKTAETASCFPNMPTTTCLENLHAMRNRTNYEWPMESKWHLEKWLEAARELDWS
ncbi:MAG: hypothetical protein IKE32_00185 [Aeriscardovia sp.]|nr:hypothetical protein [Aeriscardovia sp.]